MTLFMMCLEERDNVLAVSGRSRQLNGSSEVTSHCVTEFLPSCDVIYCHGS